MKSDVEIARAAKPRPIAEIANALGLDERNLHAYGNDVAKVDLSVLERARTRPAPARLVLVSAITPTPAGEGKTTTSIGLADALSRGDVPPLDPRRAAQSLVALIEGGVMMAKMHNDPKLLRDLEDDAMRLLGINP